MYQYLLLLFVNIIFLIYIWIKQIYNIICCTKFTLCDAEWPMSTGESHFDISKRRIGEIMQVFILVTCSCYFKELFLLTWFKVGINANIQVVWFCWSSYISKSVYVPLTVEIWVINMCIWWTHRYGRQLWVLSLCLLHSLLFIFRLGPWWCSLSVISCSYANTEWRGPAALHSKTSVCVCVCVFVRDGQGFKIVHLS